MTPQEIFIKAFQGILAQDATSTNSAGQCAYRGDNGRNCGTVCCIAGALTQFHKNLEDCGLDEVAKELGLTHEESDNLFMGETDKCDLRLAFIRPQHAARTSGAAHRPA